jgi:uncharacterized protein (DUF983 family)
MSRVTTRSVIAATISRSANAACMAGTPITPIVKVRCPACESISAIATFERFGSVRFYCLTCEHIWNHRESDDKPPDPPTNPPR